MSKNNNNKLKAIQISNKPKVLLLGNGINRAFAGQSWDDFIDRLSCGSFSKEETNLLKKDLPFPMQAIVATSDCVDYGINDFVLELCNFSVKEVQKEILKKLALKNYDAIITTNYTYEIEKSLNSSFDCQYKKRCSFRKSTVEKCSNLYDQLGIYKYFEVSLNDRVIPVWHMHGEAARPKSIVLGHYYYGHLLSCVHQMISTIIKRYSGCKQYKKDMTPLSWVDYFMTGDVDIVGLGLDLSEIDLWWLINCKKRHMDLFGGKITWYEPNLNTKKSLAKKVLAESYGVIIDTVDIHSDKYQKYYTDLINRM